MKHEQQQLNKLEHFIQDIDHSSRTELVNASWDQHLHVAPCLKLLQIAGGSEG
jgi:hypothetical protein